MSLTKKQKANMQVRLPEDLEAYLRQSAGQAYRTFTAEITMRLERTRQQDQQATTPKGNS